MNFGEVLSRAWQIIWRHKVLWIFGILAACGSASTGPNSSNLSYSMEMPANLEAFFNQLTSDQWAALIVLFLLILLCILLLAVFCNTIGRAALIRGAQLSEEGAESLGFGRLFRDSSRFFWRILGLSLLVGLVLIALILVGTILGIIATALTLGLFLLCLIPLFCLLVPLLWFITIVVEQSSNAIIIEDLGVFAGLQRGWDVTRHNLGTMLLMGLILILGIGGIGGFIIALPVFVIFTPLLFGTMFSGENVTLAGWLIPAICLVAYLPVLILLGGILKSYISTAWTLTYLRVTNRSIAEAGAVETLPSPG